MRICLLTTSYPRHSEDDAGIFVQRLVEGYSEAGRSGIVIVPIDDAEPNCSRTGNFDVLRTRYGLFTRGRLCFGNGIMPNLRRNPFLIFQAPLLIFSLAMNAWRNRAHWEVIHANWILCGVSALILNILTGRPYIITIRGEDVKLIKNRLIGFIISPVLKRAAAVVTVNEGFAKEVDKHLAPKRSVSIANGVELPELNPDKISEFAQTHNLDPSKKYLLFVGTITSRKRIDMLVELVAKLRSFELLLCGRTQDSKYMESIRSVASSLQCNDRVHILGLVPPKDVPFYMSLSRCYVTASEYEGRPNSVLESFAVRLPVVASAIDAHREIIVQRESGLLFSTVEEAAKLIIELENSPSLREKIAGTAYNKVTARSWKQCADDYLRILRAI